MEALEFLKAAKRRYKSCTYGYSEAIHLSDLDFECYVRKLEEWAKDHPAKTRQTEFLKIFPNVPLTEDGFVDICPCNLDKDIYDDCENHPRDCSECFKGFWSKEVE